MSVSIEKQIIEKLFYTSFPKPVQFLINYIYALVFDIPRSEYGKLQHYATLIGFFTRALKNRRTFSIHPQIVISPCDSKILSFGKLDPDMSFHIKDRNYSVEELLGEELTNRPRHYVSMYLSPQDYHRFHMPETAKMVHLKYLGEHDYRVDEQSVIRFNSLLKNKRVVMTYERENGSVFYLVAIGARNIGRIIIKDLPVSDNAQAYSSSLIGTTFQKGEELGRFEIGSSIFLVGEYAHLDIEIQQKVKFGDRLGICSA